MELPNRKRNRLKEYDYSQNGAYYVTMCTKNRCAILGTINLESPLPLLSKSGLIVEQEIIRLNQLYKSVVVDKYVIMPNHIHLVIFISNEENNSDKNPTVPNIIRQFKGIITKKIGKSIWQRSYYDRIIRNKDEYLLIWQYIDGNPEQWKEDEYFR